MSRENVDLVKRWVAAANRRDADAIAALCQPDVEFNSLIAEPEGGLFRGYEGIRAWVVQQEEAFTVLSGEAHDFVDGGDCMVSRLDLRLRGKGSGVEVGQQMWWAVTFRDRKFATWRVFRTKTDALEAVGLSE